MPVLRLADGGGAPQVPSYCPTRAGDAKGVLAKSCAGLAGGARAAGGAIKAGGKGVSHSIRIYHIFQWDVLFLVAVCCVVARGARGGGVG